MTAVILADGSFPQHSIPLNILRSATFVVCCDGATEQLVDWGRNPDAIVGDLDSISPVLKERFANILYPSADQGTNDLTKAVEWCINNFFDRVEILGATGLREDHTLGNISLLVDYVDKIEVEMFTDSGVFIPLLSGKTIDSFKGQQISVFSITPDTPITSSGLKYQINNRTFENWWQGTLNEAESDNFTLWFENGKLILFKTYPIL